MDIGGSLKVIGAGVAWRTLGTRSAGEALLTAMAGDDEQERMLAGMSLVKAGDRSVDLIQDAVREGRAAAEVVRLLADIGSSRGRAALTELAAEPGAVGEEATRSLELLDRLDAEEE